MAQRDNTESTPPPLVLWDLLCGMMRTQAIHHAARLGLAELLKDGKRSVSELAEATQTHAPSLLRLLRALASIDIFTEVEPEYFAQTPLSSFLQPGVPVSMYPLALLHGDDWQWRSWEGLAQSLQTGQPAFPTIFGSDIWEYFAQNTAAGQRFQDAMTGFSEQVNAAIATAAYDFASLETLVDVGGGEGTLLTTVLKVHPSLKGILFDRPDVVEQARERITQAGLAERCQVRGGDFFAEVPQGGNAYLMKQIIKDWNTDQCLQILSNCRRAMKPGGRILVVETVLLPGKGTPQEKFIDLQLMVLLHGQERYEAQFRQLFDAAGFTLTRIVPTASPYSILEGVAL